MRPAVLARGKCEDPAREPGGLSSRVCVVCEPVDAGADSEEVPGTAAVREIGPDYSSFGSLAVVIPCVANGTVDP